MDGEGGKIGMIVPHFAPVFREMDMQLPVITRLVLALTLKWVVLGSETSTQLQQEQQSRHPAPRPAAEQEPESSGH
jgi:hypothetical protein